MTLASRRVHNRQQGLNLLLSDSRPCYSRPVVLGRRRATLGVRAGLTDSPPCVKVTLFTVMAVETLLCMRSLWKSAINKIRAAR